MLETEILAFSFTFSAKHPEALKKFRQLRDLANQEGLVSLDEDEVLRPTFSFGNQYVYSWRFTGQTLDSFIGFLTVVSKLSD
jgi:hypothetical protein